MAETTTENGSVALQDRYVLRSQVADLISEHEPRWKQTPERAADTRKLLNGEIQAPIPDGFKVAGADQFRVDAPQKYLVPYHQRNMLANNPPRVKRWRMNESEPGKLESTRIEQVMQAVMDDRYKFRDSVDILLMEGCCLSISLPATASMSQVPTLYDRDGKTVKARYQRNAKGQPKSADDKSWRLSKKASAKVHDAETRDILSRSIPVDNELLGPTAFIPVFGPGLVLDAAIVERYWTQTEILKRKLVWDGMQAHLSPDGSASTAGTALTNNSSSRIKVTELHAVDYQEDDDGDVGCHPYVAYMVENGKGQRVPLQKRGANGDLVDAIICLRCEYGVRQPHFVMEWGLQWAHPDYDKKAMPFPLPFAQSWLAIDAILTGATVWAWWRGFPTLIEQPNANTPPEIDTITSSPDDDDDDVVEIAPMGYIKAKGTITELGTQGPSAIVMQLVSFLSAANQEQSGTDNALGSDASSGFQASLSRAYAEEAMADIRDSSISLFKRTSSVLFEILCGIAERWGPVPIQRITPVPLGSRSKDGGRRREILDVTKDMAGGLFDLDADFPPVPNLAKGQQWAEWASMEDPLILIEEFREHIIGDENPEIFVARRMKQKMMNSPEFMTKVAEVVAQLEGNEAERQRLQALASGQGEMGTDGVVRPVPAPPGQVNGDLTGAGVGAGNPAASALAGQLGGPIAAAQNAAAAGGMVPNTVAMGPVG